MIPDACPEAWPYPSQDLPACSLEVRNQWLALARSIAPGLALPSILDGLILPMASWLVSRPRPYVLGICGAQGTGKSSFARLLAHLLESVGLNIAVMSLDDFYLTRAERLDLAAQVHGLFATRGVPGTHDVALARRTLDQLLAGDSCVLPRFDKLRDDRSAPAQFTPVRGPVDLILFEGWCLGAEPQPISELVQPVNELERRLDPEGHWRRHVNDALTKSYAELFAQLHDYVFLKAPSLSAVVRWRLEQERGLGSRAESRALADEAAVRAFVDHFERLTCWMLERLPGRARATLVLDEDHRLTRVHGPCGYSTPK